MRASTVGENAAEFYSASTKPIVETSASIETPTFRRSEAHAAIASECTHVAREVGYTDLISFVNYLVEGAAAQDYLRHVLPGKLPSRDGALSLSPAVDCKGGLIGDMSILRLSETRFMLVGSGALSRIHLREILKDLNDFDVRFINRTETRTGFLVAGPKARRVMQALSKDRPVPAFFKGGPMVMGGVDCIALRLSYVGELSYEIHCAVHDQLKLHDSLLEAAGAAAVSLKPFSARAMNAMRIEKGCLGLATN